MLRSNNGNRNILRVIIIVIIIIAGLRTSDVSIVQLQAVLEFLCSVTLLCCYEST